MQRPRWPFVVSPSGSPQMTQYCVTALVKGAPFNCGLCLVLDHFWGSDIYDLTTARLRNVS